MVLHLGSFFITEKLNIPAVTVNYDTWNSREDPIRSVRFKRSLYTPDYMHLNDIIVCP